MLRSIPYAAITGNLTVTQTERGDAAVGVDRSESCTSAYDPQECKVSDRCATDGGETC